MTDLPHGITYVSRDGATAYSLDALLASRPDPSRIPRPERDVLLSLLRFCIDGLEHMNAREEFNVLLPLSSPPVRGGTL